LCVRYEQIRYNGDDIVPSSGSLSVAVCESSWNSSDSVCWVSTNLAVRPHT